MFPVCGQCIRGWLVPEARGGGGGFLRHHLCHARGDQRRPWQSTKTRRPEEDLQSCKNAVTIYSTCLRIRKAFLVLICDIFCFHVESKYQNLYSFTVQGCRSFTSFSSLKVFTPRPCVSSVSCHTPTSNPQSLSFITRLLLNALCSLPFSLSFSLPLLFGLHSSFTVSGNIREKKQWLCLLTASVTLVQFQFQIRSVWTFMTHPVSLHQLVENIYFVF